MKNTSYLYVKIKLTKSNKGTWPHLHFAMSRVLQKIRKIGLLNQPLCIILQGLFASRVRCHFSAKENFSKDHHRNFSSSSVVLIVFPVRIPCTNQCSIKWTYSIMIFVSERLNSSNQKFYPLIKNLSFYCYLWHHS